MRGYVGQPKALIRKGCPSLILCGAVLRRMAMEFIKYILSQTPRVLMGISIFCILAFLIPAEILKKIGLLELQNEYNALIWIALFLSLSLLFSHFLFQSFPFFSGLIKNQKDNYIGRRRLKNLSKDEKTILNKYFKENTRVQEISIYHGIKADLINFGIIYQSSNAIQPAHHTFEYSISAWAYKYLKKHPELLEGAIVVEDMLPVD
jgi:hypothetical protein